MLVLLGAGATTITINKTKPKAPAFYLLGTSVSLWTFWVWRDVGNGCEERWSRIRGSAVSPHLTSNYELNKKNE